MHKILIALFFTTLIGIAFSIFVGAIILFANLPSLWQGMTYFLVLFIFAFVLVYYSL